MTRRAHRASFAILAGGAIAATFDMVYAIVFSSMRGVSATRVMQSVASGLLGQRAYDGGMSTALLGVALHYAMALLIAAIFYLASRRLGFMTRRAVVSGLLFGISVYLVMNFVVIPLSAFPTKLVFTPERIAINVIAHMLLFGLPIALVTRAVSSRAPA